MSETQAAPGAAQPLVVNLQYVKDMSFEVPGAPGVFSTLRAAPNVNINLDVQARRLEENQNVYEVTLAIKANATEGTANGGAANGGGANGTTVFIAELEYCGVFTLTGFQPEHVEPVLLVECPRLLFPYARNILADVTRDGGFPPVLLQPIDFVALWQARRTQAAAGAPANA